MHPNLQSVSENVFLDGQTRVLSRQSGRLNRHILERGGGWDGRLGESRHCGYGHKKGFDGQFQNSPRFTPEGLTVKLPKLLDRASIMLLTVSMCSCNFMGQKKLQFALAVLLESTPASTFPKNRCS
jgi:hypothetical protein